MSGKTGISWTEATWNPVAGCSRVSTGCLHCYAIRDAHRLAGNPNDTIRRTYAGLTTRHGNGQLDWSGVVRLVPERLAAPLRWRDPVRVFVNSMSDLFHEGLPAEDIALVWAAMALAPQHTFQVLTKRPERAAALLRDVGFTALVAQAVERWIWGATHPPSNTGDARAIRRLFPSLAERLGTPVAGSMRVARALLDPWPLRQIWLGTSVEDQAAADTRIPHLLAAPAAVRFLSCEPLLSALDLSAYLARCPSCGRPHLGYCEAPRAWPLHWVIIGGESGPGARGLQAGWVNDLIGQCVEAGVAVFCKQTGSVWAREHGYTDRKGGAMHEWPIGWHMRQFPEVTCGI